MLRAVLSTALAAAAYGFALGSAHSERYATLNLIKFPLLIAITAATCAVSWWLVAKIFAVPLSFSGVQGAALRLFRDATWLLASLAPVVFFLAREMRARDDGQLGDYDLFLSANMGTIAVCGSIALVLQARRLLREQGLSRMHSGAIVLCWLALSAGVGGQAAFYLRPFFGFPATRGNVPRLFLGAEPDARGATNFYEAVWQTIARPALPSQWPEKGRELR